MTDAQREEIDVDTLDGEFHETLQRLRGYKDEFLHFVADWFEACRLDAKVNSRGWLDCQATLARRAQAQPAQDTYRGDLVRQAAFAFSPMPFNNHAALYQYCINKGDSEETAKKYADYTHQAEIDHVMAQTSRALAVFVGEAAKIAENGCLVPPDGGSPTDQEREMCDGIAAQIRALAQQDPPAKEVGAADRDATNHEAGAVGSDAPAPGFITIPLADYERLLISTETDDMIIHCENCGSWIDREDPACAHIEDFSGCWRAATCDESDRCRSDRAHNLEAARALSSPAKAQSIELANALMAEKLASATLRSSLERERDEQSERYAALAQQERALYDAFDKQSDRIAELERERDAFRSRLIEQCGKLLVQENQLTAANQRLSELLAACEPFEGFVRLAEIASGRKLLEGQFLNVPAEALLALSSAAAKARDAQGLRETDGEENEK